MRIVEMARKNKLIITVVVVYLILLIAAPEKALAALSSSGYYLKEMVTILPVIFLLTVAIDVLIPKEWIIKHMGEKSGVVGGLLSLVLGSVSAGPIYAAFPISKMLLKKGASIGNIVIILSAWAVVKVPMLANEAKFLGPSFMIVRWILTVITIFIMGWAMNHLVDKKEVMVQGQQAETTELAVIQAYCTGCGLCSRKMPEVFEMSENKAVVLSEVEISDKELLKTIVVKCPTKAIQYNPAKIQIKESEVLV